MTISAEEYEKQEPVIISKSITDTMLKFKKPYAAMAVYLHYCYTAKWQGTNQPRATVSYIAKGIGLSKELVQHARKELIGAGFIEDVQEARGHDKFGKRYVRVKFLWTKEKAREAMSSCVVPPVQRIPSGSKNRCTGNETTNALKDNNKETLEETIRTLPLEVFLPTCGGNNHSLNTPGQERTNPVPAKPVKRIGKRIINPTTPAPVTGASPVPRKEPPNSALREALLGSVRKSTKAPARTKQDLPNVEATPEVKQMIALWNESGFPRVLSYKNHTDQEHNVQSQTYIKTVHYLSKLTKGTLYTGQCHEITLPDGVLISEKKDLFAFKQHVERLKFRAFDPDSADSESFKEHLRRTRLIEFLTGNTYNRTVPHLIQYTLEKPKKLAVEKAKNPKLLEQFIETYEDLTKKKTTARDHLVLARATNRLVKFHEENKHLMKFYSMRTPNEFFEYYVIDAVQKQWSQVAIRTLSPKHFAGDSFYNRDITNYLIKINMIDEAEDLYL